MVKGAATTPLFLLVVTGSGPGRGTRRRLPTFWLVSAQHQADAWVLPQPAPALLALAWQRWEIEVAHRELKTSFGLGQPQCWGAVAATLAVQGTAWVDAVLVLSGIRCWGLGRGPVRPPGRWWRGGDRWSLDRLWQGLRQELWNEMAFRRGWPGIGDNPTEIFDWIARKTNATLAASHT